MTKDEITTFLGALRCENISTTPESEWVRASCPLAAWRHEKDTDPLPSFGVKAPGDSKMPPEYECLTCGAKGHRRQAKGINVLKTGGYK